MSYLDLVFSRGIEGVRNHMIIQIRSVVRWSSTASIFTALDLNFRGHPPLLSGNIILLQPLFTSAFLTTTVFFPLLRGHCLPTYYYCKGSKSAPATSAFEDYYARTVATLPLRRLRRRSNDDGSGLRGRLRASKGWQLAEPGTTLWLWRGTQGARSKMTVRTGPE